MKFSLYQRLSVSLSLVFIVLLVSSYLWSAEMEQRTRFESEQRLHISLAARLAGDNPLLQKGIYDHEALENLFHTLMVLGPAFEFYFVDPQGKLLTYSATPSQVKRDVISIKPILQLIQNQAPLPIYGEDPRHENRKKIFSAAPVFNHSTLVGYLYVIVTGEEYDDAFASTKSNNTTQQSIVIISATLLFLFAVMIGLFRYFTAPLCKLNRDMMAFKKANFDKNQVDLHSWEKDSTSEVEQLGYVFGEMAVQINEQLKRLTEADVHRRQLLAHISHDLRTPLASLQGFIETLALNYEKLSDVKRNEYIQVVMKNGGQLKNLIDQIFELAHLEDGQASLKLEAFNVTELLYDVIEKFSLKAQDKHITLSIRPKFSEVMISSDIGKLERILSNLIENALRHTPENGEIILQIDAGKDEQCLLTLQDNGTGIKPEELAYIFDTRYRASNATASKGQHTGLGLAITKKLVELLNADINVTSELGKGTAFTINLESEKAD